MELRHLIAPINPDSSMPIEAILEWRRVLGSNPLAGAELVKKMTHLRRLSILSALPDSVDIEEHIFPDSQEECALLSPRCRRAFIETEKSRKGYRVAWSAKFRYYPYLNLDDAERKMVAEQVKKSCHVLRSTTVCLRDRKVKFQIGSVVQGVRKVLPLLTNEQAEDIARDFPSATLFTIMAQVLPHHILDIAASENDVYIPSMGSKQEVLAFLQSTPSWGQWALGNPRFRDKSAVVEMWVSRYKYVEPYWCEGQPSYYKFWSPTKAACDITELPDRFFTEPRVSALVSAVKALPKVRVIASQKVVEKLRKAGLERAYESWEYDRMELSPAQTASKREIISPTGRILQTSQGLH
jgi:hypothetical protein